MTCITEKRTQLDYKEVMIQLIKRGDYKIGRLANNQAVIILDEKEQYSWPDQSSKANQIIRLKGDTAAILLELSGKYRICRVVNEFHLTPGDHLEISLGNGQWLTYLLPNGLPKRLDQHNKIMRTDEVITKATMNHPAR